MKYILLVFLILTAAFFTNAWARQKARADKAEALAHRLRCDLITAYCEVDKQYAENAKMRAFYGPFAVLSLAEEPVLDDNDIYALGSPDGN